jgi:hypothetical protein
MIASLYTVLLATAGLVSALPAVEVRTVTALDGGFQEAQQRDAGATRAFTAVPIKVC